MTNDGAPNSSIFSHNQSSFFALKVGLKFYFPLAGRMQNLEDTDYSQLYTGAKIRKGPGDTRRVRAPFDKGAETFPFIVLNMDAPQATQTRLLELSTMQVHNFPIDSMPSYLAISHVWSEELFAPIYLDRSGNVVLECRGMDMLRTLLEQRPELPEVKYCWVDTWCIQQSDPEDKTRQIPLMYNIYKEAQYVVVVVKHWFSFSQEEWDIVVSNLQKAFEYELDPLTYRTPEALAYYNTPEVSENLTAAMEMIEELVSIPWFRRIWTAQEYILARDILWIGQDDQSIHFHLQELNSALRIVNTKIFNGPDLGQSSITFSDALRDIGTLNDIRDGLSHPSAAIRIASTRDCTLVEDEIYGLMAASGVVITPCYGIGLENVWQNWWEKAIADDEAMWIMMGMPYSKWSSSVWRSNNCLRPHSKYRIQASSAMGSAYAGIRPYASLELDSGTVSVLGRVAGICTIETCLGQFDDLACFVKDVVSEAFTDPQRVASVFVALGSGLNPLDEILNYAAWACRREANRSKDAIDSFSAKGSRLEGDKDRRADWDVKEAPNLRFTVSAPLPGILYLGFVENGTLSTPVLVNAAEVPEEGELLAIDVGARLDNPEEDLHRFEHKSLMIVHVPKGADRNVVTLHKVGITSPVFVSELDQDGYDKSERARYSGGLVLRDGFERFRIGGDSCSYCHPAHMNNFPCHADVRHTTLKKPQRQEPHTTEPADPQRGSQESSCEHAPGEAEEELIQTLDVLVVK